MIPSDLLAARELVYDKCGFKYTQAVMEAESQEYAACDFLMNELSIKFRQAKITPTKIGQFVTLWKRKANGPIQPYNALDQVDLFIISTRSENHFGQFIFPKSELVKQGILTSGRKEGKRAMRVYPPWDITTSPQAKKTQKWQLEYFLEISQKRPVDLKRSKMLLLAQ